MKPFLAVFLPLLIAYGATLKWVLDRWNAPTQYYQHGWLLPPVAFAVIWLRREQWSKALAQPDRLALWLLVPGLLLHFTGALLMIDSLSATSLILTVPGAAWLVLGRDRLRGLWPVLLLTLFAVPPPLYLEGRVSFELKEVAVAAGAELANLLGAGVTRAGANLKIDGTAGELFVADECGGLRSLLAMITLAYCLAFFTGGRTLKRRAVLLLLAVPVAVFANIVRIALLCLMGRWWGVEFAEGTGHTLANVGEWVFDVGVLLLLDGLVSRGQSDGQLPAPAPVPMAAAGTAGLRRAAVVSWLLAPLLLWLSLYRPTAGGQDRAARLPDEIAGFVHIPRLPAAERRFQESLPRWVELLGTSDFVWREYRNPEGERVFLVALFHDTNWKSVHPPRICIEGSRMAIELDDLTPAPWLDGGTPLGRIVGHSLEDQWYYLTLSVFGTRDWVSGDYSEFFWHHLPLALLRRPQSGFLLRVETASPPEPTGLSAAARDLATQRCDRFLRGIVPAARELLR